MVRISSGMVWGTTVKQYRREYRSWFGMVDRCIKPDTPPVRRRDRGGEHDAMTAQ